MPKTALPPVLPRASALAVPFSIAPTSFEIPCPLTAFEVGEIAEQLVAEYGKDAIGLANRHANELFKRGEDARFSDWCRVITALEELELAVHAAKWKKA